MVPWGRNGRETMPLAGSNNATTMACSRVVISRVRRLSQRSTNTPEKGPTRKEGTVVATRTPLTAIGAQLCPLASMTAIHNTSVVLKTKSPIEEMADPVKRSAKFLLMRKPDLPDEEAPGVGD